MSDKQGLAQIRYWKPMVRAYNLSLEDCQHMELLITDGVQRKELDTKHKSEKTLRRRFNVESRDQLKPFAKWLVTGTCPIIDSTESLMATCINRPDGCGTTRRIEAFPFWPIDERCDSCIHRATRDLPANAHVENGRRALAKIQTLGRIKTPTPTKGSEVAGYLSKLAGGAKGIAREIWETHGRMKDDPQKNTSKTFVDLQMGLFRVLLELERIDRESRPTDDMTDEELKEYAKELLLEDLTEAQRDLFVEAYTQAEQLEYGRAQAEFES